MDIIAKKFHNYQSHLDYPKKDELLIEKNYVLSNNSYMDYTFKSLSAFANAYVIKPDLNLDHLFWYMTQDIHNDIGNYNFMLGAKYYYDNQDKVLPKKFHDLWQSWYMSQSGIDTLKKILPVEAEDYKNINFHYYFIEFKDSYGELLDNMLIVGAGILCKIYIYENILKLSNEDLSYPDCDITPFQLYNKIWEFHRESLEKYYPFFDHYSWNCKLYVLEHYTKTYFTNASYNNSQFDDSFFEHMVALPYKSLIYNDIRPHCPNYLNCSPFTKGLNLVYPEFNIKNFFSQVIIEKPTVKKIEIGLGLIKDPLPSPGGTPLGPLRGPFVGSFSIFDFNELSYDAKFVGIKPIWSNKSIHYSSYYSDLNLSSLDKAEFKTSYKNPLHKSSLDIRDQLYKRGITMWDFYNEKF